MSERPRVEVEPLHTPAPRTWHQDLPEHIREHAGVESEYGVVRDVETNGAAYRLGVEITAPGVCDRCAVKDNCYGVGATVWADGDEPITVGENVRLEMRRGTVLKATAWVYGIPLVAIVLGIFAGYRWFFATRPEEPRVLLSFALGVALMVGAGVVLARLNAWIGRRVNIRAVRSSLPV